MLEGLDSCAEYHFLDSAGGEGLDLLYLLYSSRICWRTVGDAQEGLMAGGCMCVQISL